MCNSNVYIVGGVTIKHHLNFTAEKKVHIFFHWIERLLSIWNMSHTFAQRCQNVLLFIFTFTYYNTNAIVIVVYLYLSIWEFAVFSRIFAIENFLVFFIILASVFNWRTHIHTFTASYYLYYFLWGCHHFSRMQFAYAMNVIIFQIYDKRSVNERKSGYQHSPSQLNAGNENAELSEYQTNCTKWGGAMFRELSVWNDSDMPSMDVCTMQSNAKSEFFVRFSL